MAALLVLLSICKNHACTTKLDNAAIPYLLFFGRTYGSLDNVYLSRALCEQFVRCSRIVPLPTSRFSCRRSVNIICFASIVVDVSATASPDSVSVAGAQQVEGLAVRNHSAAYRLMEELEFCRPAVFASSGDMWSAYIGVAIVMFMAIFARCATFSVQSTIGLICRRIGPILRSIVPVDVRCM